MKKPRVATLEIFARSALESYKTRPIPGLVLVSPGAEAWRNFVFAHSAIVGQRQSLCRLPADAGWQPQVRAAAVVTRLRKTAELKTKRAGVEFARTG